MAKKKGDSGDNRINGTSGKDDLDGKDGNDTIFGMAGDDKIDGGDGNDSLVGGDGEDKLKGDDGNDTLEGGADDDDLDGGEGDNLLDGGSGDDKIKTKDGDDTIDGGSGDDDIDAGDGNNVVDGGSGNDKIKTGDGDDTILGGDGDDDVKSGKGADAVFGGAGNDDIDAGSGDDTVYGELGNDSIDGGSGDDFLDGGDGDDEIDGGSGDDELFGGAGNDELDGGSGADIIDGGSGNDSIDGGSDDDDIMGGSGNDSIDGGSGDDIIAGGDGDDTIDGGSGDDIAVFSGSVSDFLITISGNDISVSDQTGAGGTDTLDDIEFIQFDDYVFDLESGANNAPIALVGEQTVDEDAQLGFDLTVVDFDGDDVSAPVVTVTSNNSTTTPGTITLVGAGVATPGYGGIGSATTFGIQYDPGDGYQFLGAGDSVTETVTVTSTDEFGGTFTQTFEIVITGSNDAPVANDDSATVAEDGEVNINVLGNDTDVDNTTAELSVVSASADNGSVVIEEDGTLTYTPNADYFGIDTINYTIEDPDGESSTAMVTVAVTPVNDAPVAVEDDATVAEDGEVNINVLGNDTDVDNTTAELSVVSASADNGSVVIEEDGTLTYTPNADYFGIDTINYTIEDPDGESSTAMVTVAVTPVNDAPVAVEDDATVAEDGEVNINVLGNDTDVDNTTAELSVVSASADNGSVVIEEDGTLTYTPNADYFGIDTINYTIEDPDGESSTAMVTVAVTPVNDAPVAVEDDATVAEDGEVNINVLGNDTDVDNTTAELSVVSASADNGSVVIEEDGTLTYTPNADYFGIDTINYTIEDPDGESSTAMVTVAVTPVNDAPVAVEDDATVAEDGEVNINVLGNDTDVDNTTAELSVVSASADNGSVVIEEDGTLTYTPNADYFGIDTINYTIEDPDGESSTAMVTVAVTPVNDAPVAVEDDATVAEDGEVNINVLGNDTDVDNTTAELSVVSASADNGSVVIEEDGTLTYTPNADYFGIDTINYTIEDPDGESSTAMVTVAVTPVNDAPVAVEDDATTAPGAAVTINVLANDTDPDNTIAELTVVTAGAENGSVVIEADGRLTYTPNPGFTGTDTIIYTIEDPSGESSTTTVSVSVEEPSTVNTPPTALDTTIAVTLDETPGADNVLEINFNTLTAGGQPIISDAEQPLAQLDITSAQLLSGGRVLGTLIQTSPNVFEIDLDTLNVADGVVGSFDIVYVVDDGQGGTSSNVITLAVTNPDDAPVNGVPIAENDSFTQDEDAGDIVIDILGEGGLASDPDGDPLEITSLTVTDAEGGALDLDLATQAALVNGVLTLDPVLFGLTDGETGTFLVNYTVSDGEDSASGVVTLNLTGTAVNTAPTTGPLLDDILRDPDDVVTVDGSPRYEIDLNPLVSDVDGDDLTFGTTVTVTDSEGNPVTATILDGVVTINIFDLENDLGLTNGGTEDLVITYTVSDGVAPDVTGTANLTVIAPPVDDPNPVTVIVDFEDISSAEGSFVPLDDIGGLSFAGTASVIEVDERVGSGRPIETGLIAGETTIDAPDEGTVAVIQGTFNGYNQQDDPTYAFTLSAAAVVPDLDAPIFGQFNPDTSMVDPTGTTGDPFNFNGMSLTALSGPDITVTIVTYRYAAVANSFNQFEYVVAGSFDVTVSSTAALDLDFFAGQFIDDDGSDGFDFDDPETTEIETSAFENIVAVQFITTGVLIPENPNDPQSEETPQNDDVLVIDDLIFTF